MKRKFNAGTRQSQIGLMDPRRHAPRLHCYEAQRKKLYFMHCTADSVSERREEIVEQRPITRDHHDTGGHSGLELEMGGLRLGLQVYGDLRSEVSAVGRLVEETVRGNGGVEAVQRWNQSDVEADEPA